MGRIISLTKSAFRDNEANFENFLPGEKRCDVELMAPKVNIGQTAPPMLVGFLSIGEPNLAYLLGNSGDLSIKRIVSLTNQQTGASLKTQTTDTLNSDLLSMIDIRSPASALRSGPRVQSQQTVKYQIVECNLRASSVSSRSSYINQYQ